MPAESLVVVGSFTVNNYDYTVNHIYLNREGVEVDRDPESGNAAYGTTITYSQRLVYQDQTYLFNSDDGPKTIGIDPAQNVLNVYYDIDVLVDPDKDPDEDPDNGDQIPDKFQVVVNYEAANGTPAISSEVLTLTDENGVYSETGTAQASMPDVAAAEGYTWYDTNWYADNAYTTVANATVTADTTFYAYCDEDDNGDNIPDKFQVTVTYVAENGTPAINSELLNLVDENGNYSETGTAQASMPEVTAAEGYTWYDTNWYADNAYTTVANATVTADTTFYAYCDEDDNGDNIPDKFQVTVTYVAENGTPAIGSELLNLVDENGNYSETGTAQASMPEVTAAEGYTWYDKNWYTDDTYTTVANATVTADTTFYAYCDEDDNGDNIPDKFQVTVTYVAENGTPAIASELLNLVDENGNYSETGTAQASMPEVTAAEGYTWYDTNWYADNAYTTVANATVTADTTFYAYCDEDDNGDNIPDKFQVTVTYVAENGTPAIGSELLNLVDENGNYSETGTAQASMPEVTAAEGYTWYDKNWYTDDTYSTVANATVTADTTFYAYCDEDDNGDNIPDKFQVTVTYVAENGTPAIGSELLNLVDENGNYSETGTAQASMPEVTAAEGYTWYDKNWYTDDTYTTVANATVTADTTFYAYCDEDDNGDNIPDKFQVTVTYVAENGTPAIASELLNLVDENGVYSETGTAQASMPEVTAAEGYTWYDKNWYTDDTYSTVANATVTADTTFYAYCDEDDNGDNIPDKFQVTVTYVAENGTPAIGSELLNLVDENGNYSETGTAQASMPEVTAAEGYTWYDTNWYADNAYTTVANATVTADTTFYAYCDTDVLVDRARIRTATRTTATASPTSIRWL